MKDIADIYIYNNTLQVVKVNGSDLLGWLEVNAYNFNQIDPEKEEDQILIDYNFRGFNFDTIAGIEYQIDVTKPKGQRIVNVTYQGQPVTEGMEFLVVTNNYRASGGGDHILNAPSAEVVYSATEENREVLINYVRNRETIDVQLESNWSIVPVETKGNVVFRSSPLGKDYIEANDLTYVSYHGEGEDGWAMYSFNFAGQVFPGDGEPGDGEPGDGEPGDGETTPGTKKPVKEEKDKEKDKEKIKKKIKKRKRKKARSFQIQQRII
ncbi:5'-nucleotidase C-terminal domain-containing protein [Anaerobacillus sp. CMMVII]|uniref:5'-nucleotidase C-terminal domain-containing protein n=1 Tax=Anaerobacillus sp. CMMVII TaxID=2755588 RepID=UPI0021B823D0|nr:5'-nucleotidase C-terminal domain-containing protein [Anaerobacillus sp. CMMVII]